MGMRVSKVVLALVLAGCGDTSDGGGGESGMETEAAGSTSSSSTSGRDPGTSSGVVGSSSGETPATSTGSGGEADASSSGGVPSGCSARPLEPGEYLGQEVVVDGVTRNYNLYVPEGYDGSSATPLVLNFHGFGSNALQQSFFSEFNVDADERGVIVAYPEGTENSWNGGVCCGVAAEDDVDDIAFVRALVEAIEDTACVDPARVYATGMSNGGFMSHRIACEAADIITAVGPVAGALVLPVEECTPARPIPVIHFHGTEDTLVPYEGNAAGYPGVEASLQGWADRNGCEPVSTVTFEMDDVSCQTWDACDDEATVTLCTLEGFGHCWPGQPFCTVGESSETIRANTMMLDLFEQHALR
ncbi:MAG: alpha/beta hydrolase family esterase [Nannocystaceae bacterium]|nr:hydrolase [bacterium]